MTKLKNLIVVGAILLALLTVYVVMRVFAYDYSSYPKVFYEYKEKGKSSNFSPEDVRKGFQ